MRTGIIARLRKSRHPAVSGLANALDERIFIMRDTAYKRRQQRSYDRQARREAKRSRRRRR